MATAHVTRRTLLKRSVAFGSAVPLAWLAGCGGASATSGSVGTGATSSAIATVASSTSKATATSATSVVTSAAAATTTTVAPGTSTTLAASSVAASTSAAPSTRTTLTMWHEWGGDRVPLMDAQVKGFMAKYPNIQVNATLLTFAERQDKLTAAVAGNDPPDVVMASTEDVPSYYFKNFMLPIDAMMKADGVSLDIFYPVEAQASQYAGKTWILSTSSSGGQGLIFFNKQLFRQAGLDPEKPPATWQEYYDTAKKLTVVKDNVLDVYGGGPPNYPSPGIIYANAGTYLSADGKKVTLDSAETVEAVQWYLNMQNQVLGGAEAIKVWSQNNKSTDPFYISHRGMTQTGPWYFFYIEKAAPTLEYGVTLPPYGRAGKPVIASGYAWGYVMPPGIKHPDAAWPLVKWLTIEQAGAGEFLKAQGQPSAVA